MSGAAAGIAGREAGGAMPPRAPSTRQPAMRRGSRRCDRGRCRRTRAANDASGQAAARGGSGRRGRSRARIRAFSGRIRRAANGAPVSAARAGAPPAMRPRRRRCDRVSRRCAAAATTAIARADDAPIAATTATRQADGAVAQATGFPSPRSASAGRPRRVSSASLVCQRAFGASIHWHRRARRGACAQPPAIGPARGRICVAHATLRPRHRHQSATPLRDLAGK